MRLVHDGYAALRILDDRDRILLVDPSEVRHATDVRGRRAAWVCLTGGPWPERYLAAKEVIGLGPVVAGPPPLSGTFGRALDWRGVDGVTVEAQAYTPPAEPTVTGVRARLRRRWSTRSEAPIEAPPHVLRLEIAEGHRLVHLGLSLHADTPSAFLDRVQPWMENATVIAGFAHGHSEPFLEALTRLRPRRVLLMDQIADKRRELGLPVELVTPVRDVLVSRGIETHPFVSGTSHRFERDDTVKRW